MIPVLVGLHNPYSPDPAHALAPTPVNSSGHRLWKMLDDADESAKYSRHYRHIFARYNLARTIDEVEDASALANRAKVLLRRDILRGSTVVLLGDKVRRAFKRATGCAIEPVFIHPQVACGVAFRCIPHPSGRSTVYNHSCNRLLVGLMLEDLANQWENAK